MGEGNTVVPGDADRVAAGRAPALALDELTLDEPDRARVDDLPERTLPEGA